MAKDDSEEEDLEPSPKIVTIQHRPITINNKVNYTTPFLLITMMVIIASIIIAFSFNTLDIISAKVKTIGLVIATILLLILFGVGIYVIIKNI